MKKSLALVCLFVCCLILIVPAFVAAIVAHPAGQVADPSMPAEVEGAAAKAEIIFYGIFGVGIMGLVAIVKRFLKTSGIVTILLSVGVSLAGTAYQLVSDGAFTLPKWLLTGGLVALMANGIYLSTVKRTS